MYKFGTRYFNPANADWIQWDPKTGSLQNPMSENPYLYIGDDPVNGVDPSGQWSLYDVGAGCVTGVLDLYDVAEPFVLYTAAYVAVPGVDVGTALVAGTSCVAGGIIGGFFGDF